jgi:uncharacterized protein YcbK (DUF882 family)
MGDLSQHFSSHEFKDKRTGEMPGIDSRLLTVLECIRAISGQPLTIVSGYRSRATNTAVGGARNSQHLYGRAADIPAGRCTLAQAYSCGATGVGVDRHGWAVHVDVRPGPQVTWRYP